MSSKINEFKDLDLKSGNDLKGEQTINASLGNILGTPRYTVPGEPSFGLLAGTVFAQNDAVSRSLLMDAIKAEVSRRDSRITITGSDVVQNENSITLTLNVSIMNERDYQVSLNMTSN